MTDIETTTFTDGTALTEIPTPAVATTAGASGLVVAYTGGILLADPAVSSAWVLGVFAVLLLLGSGGIAAAKGVANLKTSRDRDSAA